MKAKRIAVYEPLNDRAAQRYIRSIRNENKRRYAAAYWQHLNNQNTPTPDYDCSTMAAQAVRMRLLEIISGMPFIDEATGPVSMPGEMGLKLWKRGSIL